MAELKTQKSEESVEAFMASVEDPVRQADCRTVAKLMAELTGAPPKMWGKAIIGFGTYHYTYASGREGDWMLVGLSPRKTALTVYIMDGFSDYAALMARLGKHKTGKSCLHIKKLTDVDLTVLRALIEASITATREKYPAQ